MYMPDPKITRPCRGHKSRTRRMSGSPASGRPVQPLELEPLRDGTVALLMRSCPATARRRPVARLARGQYVRLEARRHPAHLPPPPPRPRHRSSTGASGGSAAQVRRAGLPLDPPAECGAFGGAPTLASSGRAGGEHLGPAQWREMSSAKGTSTRAADFSYTPRT